MTTACRSSTHLCSNVIFWPSSVVAIHLPISQSYPPWYTISPRLSCAPAGNARIAVSAADNKRMLFAFIVSSLLESGFWFDHRSGAGGVEARIEKRSVPTNITNRSRCCLRRRRFFLPRASLPGQPDSRKPEITLQIERFCDVETQQTGAISSVTQGNCEVALGGVTFQTSHPPPPFGCLQTAQPLKPRGQTGKASATGRQGRNLLDAAPLLRRGTHCLAARLYHRFTRSLSALRKHRVMAAQRSIQAANSEPVRPR